MTINKGFLKTDTKNFKIPRKRIVIGIILGLISVFLIYSLLYLFREAFRYLSITEDFDMWILTDKEVAFYNLFYAFLAVIFSQSFVLIFLFNRPKRIFNNSNWRKITIVNDQRVLNLYFLNWFTKLAFIFALMFGFGYSKGYYAFSFYPDYKYLFFLIIIVLFFQSFNTIKFTFRNKSNKWLIASILFLTLLSFGLSKINILDYKKINKSVLDKCIFKKYDLILPETDFYKRTKRLNLVENIYLVNTNDKSGKSQPIILIDNQEVDYDKLSSIVLELQNTIDEFERPLMTYRLHIHENIELKYINRLKLELAKCGISIISYAVTPKNPIYDRRYYQNLNYYTKLLSVKSDLYYGKNDSNNKLKSYENIIEINIDSLGNTFINRNSIEFSNLKKELKKLVKENNNYIFKVYVFNSNTFSKYFQLISTCRQSIFELRNEYSMTKYSNEYNNLDISSKNNVDSIYYEAIFELTDELNF